MKTILLTIAILISAQAALADIIKKPIHNAEVVVFDAICTPTSSSEGYLTVSLQMTSEKLFIRGTFYSHSESSTAKDPKNWHLIPLKDCQDTQSELSQQAGRKIFLSGQYFEQAYDAYEDVWGTCREHPLAGGGTYPCIRGTRKVTKYDRETVLSVGTFNILNKNK
jgi:hypothetical protein